MSIIFEEIDGTGTDLFTPHPYVKKVHTVKMEDYKAKKDTEKIKQVIRKSNH